MQEENGVILRSILLGGVMIEIVKGDITTESTDAIVNAANENLKHVGGLAHAISSAGGPSIQRECEELIARHGIVRTGYVAHTGAGELPCKFIIHAVGPHWQGEQGESVTNDQLFKAVFRSLKLAVKLECNTVSLPAISGNIFGYPLDLCAEIIISAIATFVNGQENTLSTIRVCLIDENTIREFIREFDEQLASANSDDIEKEADEIVPISNMQRSEDELDRVTTPPATKRFRKIKFHYRRPRHVKKKHSRTAPSSYKSSIGNVHSHSGTSFDKPTGFLSSFIEFGKSIISPKQPASNESREWNSKQNGLNSVQKHPMFLPSPQQSTEIQRRGIRKDEITRSPAAYTESQNNWFVPAPISVNLEKYSLQLQREAALLKPYLVNTVPRFPSPQPEVPTNVEPDTAMNETVIDAECLTSVFSACERHFSEPYRLVSSHKIFSFLAEIYPDVLLNKPRIIRSRVEACLAMMKQCKTADHRFLFECPQFCQQVVELALLETRTVEGTVIQEGIDLPPELHQPSESTSFTQPQEGSIIHSTDE